MNRRMTSYIQVNFQKYFCVRNRQSSNKKQISTFKEIVVSETYSHPRKGIPALVISVDKGKTDKRRQGVTFIT